MSVLGGLVQQGMQQSALRSQQLGAGGVGRTLKLVLEEALKDRREERQQTKAIQQTAAQAYYGRYPQAAAQAMGVDVPAGTGTVSQPEGMRGTKVVYDEAGRPTYTFEAPAVLDEVSLGKMYNQYVTELQRHNALYGSMPKYKAEIKSFNDWKSEYFPEMDFSKDRQAQDINIDELSDAEISEMLEQQGYAGTAENVIQFRNNIKRMQQTSGSE